MSQIQGTVFDIQKFSLNDGPGIRTVVFLKGGPLSCQWCHNPESLCPERQLQYIGCNCTLCKKCRDVCPTGAHVFDGEIHQVDFDRCILCGKCVEVCCYDALRMLGRTMTVEQVRREIREETGQRE